MMGIVGRILERVFAEDRHDEVTFGLHEAKG